MRVFLLAVLLVSAASAQPSNWAFPAEGASVTLEADRAFFTDRLPYEGTTSAWALSTAVPVGPVVRIVGDLPFAFATIRGRSSTALGNLQVGAEADLAEATVTLGGYVRVPTATESGNSGRARTAGEFIEYEQSGAFVSDIVTDDFAFASGIVTVSALADTRLGVVGTPGASLRLRVLPQVLVPLGEYAPGAKAFLGYAAQALYDAGSARFGGGLTGVTVLNPDGDGDTTQLFLGGMVEADAGPFRPGLVARVPVSGALDRFVDAVVGVRLTYVVE